MRVNTVISPVVIGSLDMCRNKISPREKAGYMLCLKMIANVHGYNHLYDKTTVAGLGLFVSTARPL